MASFFYSFVFFSFLFLTLLFVWNGPKIAPIEHWIYNEHLISMFAILWATITIDWRMCIHFDVIEGDVHFVPCGSCIRKKGNRQLSISSLIFRKSTLYTFMFVYYSLNSFFHCLVCDSEPITGKEKNHWILWYDMLVAYYFLKNPIWWALVFFIFKAAKQRNFLVFCKQSLFEYLNIIILCIQRFLIQKERKIHHFLYRICF